MAVFAEKGFAGARLDEIARRAGVSKGSLYLYFETKDDIFRAVVSEAVAPNLEPIRAMALAHEGPFGEIAVMILRRIARTAATRPVGAVAKMVIGESRNFPDLARIWHDQAASQVVALLAQVVERAQARGEVRPGDPRLFAVSLVGPMVMGLLWQEVFAPIGAEPIDLDALAVQHGASLLPGMLTGSIS